jgi:HSP20 family protein
MARELSSTGAPLTTLRGSGLLGRDMFRDYARLVDSMFRAPSVGALSTEQISPTVDVVENDKTIDVMADIPGIDEKDIKVELRNGTLWITGERKEESTSEGRNFHRSERSFGSFERGIGLSCDVEKGNIEATFKNGVLKVSLPKTKEAREQVTQIKIKH